MLKSKYKIYLLLLCLTGCVSEYNAQLPSSDEELLVVTGDIIANTEAIFSLSKSIPLSEDMPEDYRNIYARIAVATAIEVISERLLVMVNTRSVSVNCRMMYPTE